MPVDNLLTQVNTRISQGHGNDIGRLGAKGDVKKTDHATGSAMEAMFGRNKLSGKTEATQKAFADAVVAEIKGKHIPMSTLSNISSADLKYQDGQVVAITSNKISLNDAKTLLEAATGRPSSAGARPAPQTPQKPTHYTRPSSAPTTQTSTGATRTDRPPLPPRSGGATAGASVNAPPVPPRASASDNAISALRQGRGDFHSAIESVIAERYGDEAADQVMSSVDRSKGHRVNPEFYETSPAMVKNNRYKNIAPPKHSLVPSSGTPLNANFVTIGGKMMGIAMQAPKAATVDSVWAAVDQQNVSLIVDLTNANDKGTKGIPHYRPEDGSIQRDSQGGFFEVTHNSGNDSEIMGVHPRTKKEEAKFTIEDFTISRQDGDTGEIESTKSLKSVNYNFWPDHGVVSLNDLKEIVGQIEQNKGDGEVLIHCTAGVGRTGTVYGALALTEMARSGELTAENADQKVLDIIIDGRISRGASFVQTPEQAKLLIQFAHDLVG